MDKSGKDLELDELAQKARLGDQWALGQLAEHHAIKGVVYKIAHEKGFFHTDADDLYGDVCERICKYIHTWSGTNKVTSWVSAIARNRCIDIQRKEQHFREYAVSIEEPGNENTEPNTRIAPMIPLLIQETMSQIGEECQRILQLYLFDGLKGQAIIQHLSLSKGEFYRRLKKCYAPVEQSFREILQKIREK